MASCNKLMKLIEKMRFSKSSTLLLKPTLLGFPFSSPLDLWLGVYILWISFSIAINCIFRHPIFFLIHTMIQVVRVWITQLSSKGCALCVNLVFYQQNWLEGEEWQQSFYTGSPDWYIISIVIVIAMVFWHACAYECPTSLFHTLYISLSIGQPYLTTK